MNLLESDGGGQDRTAGPSCPVHVSNSYHHNDLKLRSQYGFIAAAKEVGKNSIGKRIRSVQGVKGLSCLLDIMAYPQSIPLDYVHLVCLGHVQTLIKRWCQLIDKEKVMKMDNMLLNTRVPHNIHVVYNELISTVECWKVKHFRLFVLNTGLPIGIICLPILNASHWTIYYVAIKLLHAPESIEDINFAEHLINYYCRTISEVYDQSLEYYSLHAHLHLPPQVHGTKHLANQIAYWCDMENIVKNEIFEVPSSTGVNQIHLNNGQLVNSRELIVNLIQMNDHHLIQVEFYKRYKHQFTTYHTTLKSNLHGSNDNGPVTIKDRGKTYVGYCLFEGSLTEVEAAAERLDKQMNSDLESDCETLKSNSKFNVQRTQQIMTSASSSNSSIQISDCTPSTVRSLANTRLDSKHIKHYGTPPPTDVAVHSKVMRETLPKRVRYRIAHYVFPPNGASAYQALREIQYMLKNKENERQTRNEEVIDLDNSSLSISVATDKNNIRLSKRPLSNSFSTTAREKTAKRICNKLFPSENGGNKEMVMLLEAPLSLNQDINVPLNGTHFGSEVQSEIDASFQSTLIYKNQNGESIDLIQLYGVRTQLGHFGTLVMDQLFTKEELISNSKDELIKDERYYIMKEAV
ncbi:unnamed protein product [Rotaria socialis]|uniref:Uncharacterized protein n=1 Tax=Rotaria socialis TaxID=392032 RepID=A0A820V2M7_9BILA|nr:unnamed protein product [Rotaria socialis]